MGNSYLTTTGCSSTRDLQKSFRSYLPGFTVTEHQRIFRRFYRVDQRLSRETAGVGLGLSIVELVMRAHGGSVAVQSAPGAGSTFTLRVPCAPQSQTA